MKRVLELEILIWLGGFLLVQIVWKRKIFDAVWTAGLELPWLKETYNSFKMKPLDFHFLCKLYDLLQRMKTFREKKCRKNRGKNVGFFQTTICGNKSPKNTKIKMLRGFKVTNWLKYFLFCFMLSVNLAYYKY